MLEQSIGLLVSRLLRDRDERLACTFSNFLDKAFVIFIYWYVYIYGPMFSNSRSLTVILREFFFFFFFFQI